MLDKRWAFKTGFVSGLGFAVAVVTAFYVWDYLSDNFGPRKAFSEQAGVVITEHRIQRGPFDATVFGTIRNGGKQSWNLVNVRVELQDKAGKFVDSCSGRLDGTIRPDQVRNFKVSCYGSKDQPVPAVEKYTVTVDDAYLQKGY